ncbi:hypothetical protein [Streptomyces sp. NPDC056244]|uniref:hypothetical protein n=1 Tax=Streptomyces sp. NPDC056244 TaxID=3345762 RepID=UPI0035D95CD9
MSDSADDVMTVITEQIEKRFGMGLPELRRAVAAAPDANSAATEVVYWHGLLSEAQTVLERAEDELVTVLHTRQGELDDPAMDLAHQVNTAVAVRDGRAVVITYLLDPDSPGKQNPGASRGPAPAAGHRPALRTSPPARPATTTASAPARRAGR